MKNGIRLFLTRLALRMLFGRNGDAGFCEKITNYNYERKNFYFDSVFPSKESMEIALGDKSLYTK